MKKQQQIVKVNNTYSISIVKYEELPYYEVAVLENGEITYKFRSDVERYDAQYVGDLEEGVQELINEITVSVLEEEFSASVSDGEATTFIEGFTYNVWAYTCYNFRSNKLWWELCTVHTERYESSDDIEDAEANKVVRKTFKGLHNYISKFADK